MFGGIVLGAIAGASLATLPGAANVWAGLAGAVAGAILEWRLGRPSPGFSPWSMAVLAFLVPVFTMAVAPGADMAMHVALARGLVEGQLSPAWPGVSTGAYPRGFSAMVALLWPLGPARAGLLAAGLSYLVFWAGLAALLQTLRVPAARTVAAVAVLLSRTPQAFFGWGGNPTALALGLAFFGAAQPRAALSALYLGGAAAVHPMGAIAGALPLVLRWREPRVSLTGAAAICAVAGALALFGPRLSPRELEWIRDYAVRQEHASAGVLGDPANVVTGAAVAVLLWKRRFASVARGAATVLALFALFALLPRAGLYPIRFAPLLLVAVAPLWSEAAAARIPLLAPIALLAALSGHLRWYQQATAMATGDDLAAIECLDRAAPKDAVVDGAYGDATQWIPALTGRAVTRPHQHVSLFDETDAALARLPAAHYAFKGQRTLYGVPLASPPGTPLCGPAALRF